MTRSLTTQQKSWLNKCGAYQSIKDLHETMVKKIISLNDYETVYQDIDKFLSDNCMNRRVKNFA